jgi:hypothetical protein
MSSKWRFRLRRTFFGLTDEYVENVYEQFFYLQYVGGWSFIEAYNLPIGLRNWFIKRLAKQIETENKSIEEASSGNRRRKTYSVDELSMIPGLGEGLTGK